MLRFQKHLNLLNPESSLQQLFSWLVVSIVSLMSCVSPGLPLLLSLWYMTSSLLSFHLKWKHLPVISFVVSDSHLCLIFYESQPEYKCCSWREVLKRKHAERLRQASYFNCIKRRKQSDFYLSKAAFVKDFPAFKSKKKLFKDEANQRKVLQLQVLL